MKKFYLALVTAIMAVGAVYAAPEGEWEKVSTGIWYEGPIAKLCGSQFTDEWEVDVYEHATVKGWYRVYPYKTAVTELTKQYGNKDNAIYICAVNPDRVYFEDFSVYGFDFRACVNETGYANEFYGTLKDGIIDMNTWVLWKQGSDDYKFTDKCFKLLLDKGPDDADYTLDMEVPAGATTGTQTIKFTKGNDIATVKASCFEGIYYINGNTGYATNDITECANGVSFGLGGPHKIYTCLYVGLNAAGTIKAQGNKFIVITEEDADDWTTLGEATFNEAIISNFFSDVDAEDLRCEIQENKTTSGLYRLINPYANHSKVLDGSYSIPTNTDKYYLYVNASDPDHVYIDASAPGLRAGDSHGEVIYYSRGRDYIENIAGGEAANVWGKLADGKITIPAGNDKVRIHLTNYQQSFVALNGTDEIVINLPKDPAGISDIESDDANAPVEYFNLQGIKIENPAPGQIVIRRQGSKVSKIIL